MHRRRFLTSAAALAITPKDLFAMSSPASTPAPGNGAREYYQLRRYQLPMGPQPAQAESYLNGALIPALGRLGLGPVGAFKLEFGPETPAYFLLIPAHSAETLATLDLRLADDAEFVKAGAAFWSSPAATPAFTRFESSLLLAFAGWPRLTVPEAANAHAKRIFQLRTYESPSHAAHIRKVEMFNNGEFAIFQRTGLHPVFFGETLIGSRMPSLTYMLTFSGMQELETNWAAFSADPAWKKLSTDPRYSYEPIVSSITNLVLSPLAASQI